mmetsp:Transcript_25235/g.84844  ORF Transcript_25235/g.84844 Transcript_25235/m.84844 type:complete len:341 (+) Transcript_25235:411-1433(+)
MVAQPVSCGSCKESFSCSNLHRPRRRRPPPRRVHGRNFTLAPDAAAAGRAHHRLDGGARAVGVAFARAGRRRRGASAPHVHRAAKAEMPDDPTPAARGRSAPRHHMRLHRKVAQTPAKARRAAADSAGDGQSVGAASFSEVHALCFSDGRRTVGNGPRYANRLPPPSRHGSAVDRPSFRLGDGVCGSGGASAAPSPEAYRCSFGCRCRRRRGPSQDPPARLSRSICVEARAGRGGSLGDCRAGHRGASYFTAARIDLARLAGRIFFCERSTQFLTRRCETRRFRALHRHAARTRQSAQAFSHLLWETAAVRAQVGRAALPLGGFRVVEQAASGFGRRAYV